VQEEIVRVGVELGAQHAANNCSGTQSRERILAYELAQKLLLIHVILEGLAAINEDYWNLVIVLAAKVGVGVNVNLAPGKTAAAGKLGEALFHDFAKMTSLARINDNVSRLRHCAEILARRIAICHQEN
jgi:hypothetical protein